MPIVSKKGWIVVDGKNNLIAKARTKKEALDVMKAFKRKNLSAIQSRTYWRKKLNIMI
jgi:hypothetical protein